VALSLFGTAARHASLPVLLVKIGRYVPRGRCFLNSCCDGNTQAVNFHTRWNCALDSILIFFERHLMVRDCSRSTVPTTTTVEHRARIPVTAHSVFTQHRPSQTSSLSRAKALDSLLVAVTLTFII